MHCHWLHCHKENTTMGLCRKGQKSESVMRSVIEVKQVSCYATTICHSNRGFAWRGTQLYAHDFAPLLGFLFVWCSIEKDNKKCLNFSFTWQNDLKFPPSVCVLICMSLCWNLVLWYELDKYRDILLCLPIPSHAKRKPTWRSGVWWLTKLACYDVTWKPSIQTNPCMSTVCQCILFVSSTLIAIAVFILHDSLHSKFTACAPPCLTDSPLEFDLFERAL